jgi:hypothetical protein
MVARILYVWSFLIVLRAVEFTYQVDFWPALVCVGLSWLLMLGIATPSAYRSWPCATGSGTKWSARSCGSAQDILSSLAAKSKPVRWGQGGNS